MNGAGLWMAGLWLTPFLTVVLSLRELFNPCGSEASEVQVRKWRVGEVRRVDQGPQLVHGEAWVPGQILTPVLTLTASHRVRGRPLCLCEGASPGLPPHRGGPARFEAGFGQPEGAH